MPNSKPMLATASFFSRLKQTLYRHYTASQKEVFKQFRLGVALFFIGLVGVYANYNLLSESLAQEWFLLLSLLVVVAGFVVAMLAQLRMLIGRILHFILH